MSSWSTVLGVVLGILLIGCSTPTPAISPTATPETQVKAPANVGQTLPVSAQATIASRTIELEVAKTQQQQATGLMGRASVPDNRGMLFLFNSPQNIRFWMKNVNIPLDMIFMKNGEVKAIAASVPPCKAEPCPTYGANTAVNQVIELRGGRAAELGLKVNDKIKIKFLSLQR